MLELPKQEVLKAAFAGELKRLKAAFGFSKAGLRVAWGEAAFRLECRVAAVLLPFALILPATGSQRALLAGSLLLVLVVELLNTAVEKTIDRISLEPHQLSGQAKDLGSAAVLISLILTGIVWLSVLFT